ncbi:hypothetical protein [Fodinibius sediminis]|uniref:Quinol:cytochrome c oxidoreductase quinone-binding subunit 2 n=1 Tax=Fodinibius sediminis TaxID=1214077 RepID=A0A521C917_9BACT|nr:hypothetical protein [Fodinibius sediminis]SMO55906.1 quinol:cytochrome c oxidoreductase quinone-binding subunit 2 [Fodinibius sediminis]
MSKPKLTDTLEFPSDLNVTKSLFGVGVVGLIASGIGYFLEHDQFFFSYLVNFAFFSSIALASLFFVLIQHLTRSHWSVAIRRIPETISSNLWIWGLFLIPVLLGMHSLYHWTHADAVTHDPVLQGKSPYLDTSFFIIRQVIYFALWSFLGYRLYTKSVEMDKTGDWGLQTLLRRTSGPGLFLFGITLAFASFDWLMSLDPHWYSTIFGVYYFAMSFQVLFAVLILMVLFLWKKGLLTNTIKKGHIYDLGVQLFGFTVFYAYIAFSQFLLIYYANIPEETVWFLERLNGGYEYLAYFYLFGRFVIPFVVLLPKRAKSNFKIVGTISVLILASHLVELYWIVMPVLDHHGFHFNWMTLTSFVGLGGIFMGLFFRKFKQEKMIPVNDPRLGDSINKH